MKIHILYNLKEGPWGGGNQFLKALKKEFERKRVYAREPEKADVVLFNSHHFFNNAFKLKKKFPEKIFIHRVDGPIGLYRGKDKIIDKAIFGFSALLADGIVFQSHWSKEQNQKICNNKSIYETVVYNASDSAIFNKRNKKPFKFQGKIRLIAVSWSSNIRKGFEVYKYLDENLDFSKYKMVFVGNSPVKFKNIEYQRSLPSEDLANVLKSQDIYITASQKDPCSNSLIEALSCGLPAVALRDGGHPELVQQGGEMFENKQDVIESINRAANNYLDLQSKIPEFSIKKAAEEYYGLAKKIFNDVENKTYQPKKLGVLSLVEFWKIKSMFLCSKV